MTKPVLLIDNTVFSNIAGHGAAADGPLLRRSLDGLARTYDLRITDEVFFEAVRNSSKFPKDRAVAEWFAEKGVIPIQTTAGEAADRLRTNNQPVPPDMGERSIVDAWNKPELANVMKRIASDDRYFSAGNAGEAYRESTYQTPRLLHNLVTEGAMDIVDYRRIAARTPTLHARDPALTWMPEEKLGLAEKPPHSVPPTAPVPETGLTTVATAAEPPIPAATSGRKHYGGIRPTFSAEGAAAARTAAPAGLAGMAIWGAVKRYGGQLQEDLKGSGRQKIAGVTAMFGDGVNALGGAITVAAEATAGLAAGAAERLGAAARIAGKAAWPIAVTTTAADMAAGAASDDPARVAGAGGSFAGGVAGGFGTGFAVGAVLGVESGPGLVVTGLIGGFIGAYLGEQAAKEHLVEPVRRLMDHRPNI